MQTGRTWQNRTLNHWLFLYSKRPNFKPTRTKFELWIRVRHNTTTNWRKPVLPKWRVNLQYKIQSQKFQALAIVAFFIQKYMNGVSHSALIMEKQCKLLYNYLIKEAKINWSFFKELFSPFLTQLSRSLRSCRWHVQITFFQIFIALCVVDIHNAFNSFCPYLFCSEGKNLVNIKKKQSCIMYIASKQK